MTANFPDPLDLRDAGMRGSSRVFRLTHYFRYASDYGMITVPTGTTTDGASIPSLFWPILKGGPQGRWFYAAIIHDYLYSLSSNAHFLTTRLEADEIFLDAMKDLEVPWLQRMVIFRAVRLFGWASFKKRRS